MGALTGFIFLLLVLSNPSFVYSAETNLGSTNNPLILGSETNNQTNNQNQLPTSLQNGDNNVPNPSQVAPGSCSVSTLTPSEAKGILDLTHNGFSGKAITDGQDGNGAEVRDIGDTSLIGREIGGDKAIKVTAPNYATNANRFSALDGYTFSGPFGIGLILDDTLRVGRCTNLPQSQCLINGDGLQTRTSGVGFKEDLTNAFNSVVGTTKTVAEAALSAADYNKMRNNYLPIDSNDFKTGSFGKGEAVSNSILTNEFLAKSATTCNNSACTISTYSAFDKYFNAWLTTDLVVTNIGPMLLHKSNKLLTQAYKSFGGDPLKSKFGLHLPQKLSTFYSGITSPMSLFGTARDQRFKALMQESGLTQIIEEPLIIKRNLWRSGGGGEIGKLTDPSSPLWKLTPEKRKQAFEAIEHLNAYSRASAEYIDEAKNTYLAAKKAAADIPDPALRAAAEQSAKMDFAMKSATNLDDWDNVLALDYEDWAKANEDIFSFGGYAVKKNGDWANDTGFVDISSGQPFNFKRVVQTFGRDGDWSKWAGSMDTSTFKVAADGRSLQLYKIAPKSIVEGGENVGIQELRFHLSNSGAGTLSIKFPDGTYRPLNEASIKYIESNPALPGHVSVFNSGYVPAEPMTPDDFANRVLDERALGRPKTAVRATDDLKNALIQNEYVPRNYTSLLDKQFAAEGDMIKNYYKNPVTGVYKGLVLPVLYWDFKQGGANYTGNKDYSAFLLPDSWSTLTITQGVDKIYSDAYIDFFVNEGSDQGDMFKRAFNSLPFVWTQVVKMGAATNQTVADTLSRASGGFFEGAGSMRDTVGDVAFYSQNENCSGCFGKLNLYNDSKGQYLVLNGFSAPVTLQAFLLEASTQEEKSEQGSTIISYAHHSSLQGKTGQVEGEAIDISKARINEATCDQRLRKFGLGWAGNAAGGVLGAVENVGYLVGFGPGLMVSLVQQLTIGRELQDCIDDVEGYYVHFYAPPTAQAAKAKTTNAISNEKVAETLSSLTDKLDSIVKEKTPSETTRTGTNVTPVRSTSVQENTTTANANPVQKSMDSLKSQFDEFASKAKQANILQATVDLMAPTSGKIMGKDIFYFWFKDTMMPGEYRTSGKTIISDGNMQLEADFSNGTLKLNGKTLIDSNNADHTRMIAHDLKIPADIVPMTLNKVSAPMNSNPVFELNTFGEVKVMNAQVLNCIQRAVFDQVGIEYAGDELTQVFGSLQKISTQTYGTIFARGGKIYLEGLGPRAQGEAGSRLVIDGYWNTKLVVDSNTSADTGKFVSMNFERGTIVLKPETNEIIVWLRQHKDSILMNSDVKGLNAKLTSVKDPENECDTPAIDLEAVPFNNDELGTKKVDNFNKSMGKLGPFTQFTTGNRIYEFYSQKDATSGECKNFFRVRDRNTGKILTDQEIIGGVKQSADGTISFTTADGKQHTLSFDAENGVPKISYDGGPAETLLSAQGPNGSFWYDPEKGMWYPENGLQVPLNQAFKDNGAWFGTDSKGNVVGTPENKITFNAGNTAGTGFSLPSMPQTAAGIALFVTLFLIAAFMLTSGRQRKRKP
jgi:hypothetical protein